MVGEDINRNMIFRVLVSPLSSALHTLLAFPSPRTMSNSWHHACTPMVVLHGTRADNKQNSWSLPPSEQPRDHQNRQMLSRWVQSQGVYRTIPECAIQIKQSGSYGNSRNISNLLLLAFLFIFVCIFHIFGSC